MVGDEANAARPCLSWCDLIAGGKVRGRFSRSLLQLTRPIQNGVVKDWEGMEAANFIRHQQVRLVNPVAIHGRIVFA